MNGELEKPNPASFIASIISQAFEQAAKECDEEAESYEFVGAVTKEGREIANERMEAARDCAHRIRAMAGEREPPYCARRDGCPDIMACASFGVPGYCGERNR